MLPSTPGSRMCRLFLEPSRHPIHTTGAQILGKGGIPEGIQIPTYQQTCKEEAAPGTLYSRCSKPEGPKAQEMGNSRGERRNLRALGEVQRTAWSLQCDLPRQRAGPEMEMLSLGSGQNQPWLPVKVKSFFAKTGMIMRMSEVMWRMNLSLTSS